PDPVAEASRPDPRRRLRSSAGSPRAVRRNPGPARAHRDRSLRPGQGRACLRLPAPQAGDRSAAGTGEGHLPARVDQATAPRRESLRAVRRLRPDVLRGTVRLPASTNRLLSGPKPGGAPPSRRPRADRQHGPGEPPPLVPRVPPRLVPQLPDPPAAPRPGQQGRSRSALQHPRGGERRESVRGDLPRLMDALPAAFEERWARWLLESNRRRTRTGLYIACALLPFFGVLDYMLAPPGTLRILWGVRLAVLMVTYAAFPIVRTRFFERHPSALTSAYVALIAFSILLGIAVVGGTGQIVLYRSLREQVLNQVRLEETKASLEAAHEQLKALDSFKSQFFANITHEFKTPLAMVLAPLELILQGEMGELSAAHRGTFESMFRSGLKLLKMIGDLLDLSRMEESKLRLKVAEHDLAEYLRALVSQVQPLAQRKGIELSLRVEATSTVVWCDLERIERVFLNLLSNATKFTQPGGHVQVIVREASARIEVVVQDDGPGFPPEKADRIFERFYQVDMGGTRRYGGTGIGLALAKEIVELHGGQIRAESSGGAKFTDGLLRDRDHFPAEVLDRRGPARGVPEGHRANDRGLMDFAVQMAARDEYRLLDIAEATDRRVSVRDTDEDHKPHVAL